MEKKYVYLTGVVVLIVAVIISLILFKGEQPSPTTGEKWEVIMDFLTPYNFSDSYSGPCGLVTISLPESSNASPVDKLREILGNLGESGQYGPGDDLVENTKDNVVHCSYEFGAVSGGHLDSNVPSIRQDNVGENFCFCVNIRNIVSGGGTTWWDRIGCDSLIFTLILPDGYELASDVAEPFGWGGKGYYKDNEFSIFTAASTLIKKFENNRWTIEANWIQDEFDKFNTDFYLEVYYRKVS